MGRPSNPDTEKRQVIIGVTTDAGKRFNAIRADLAAKHGFTPTSTQTLEYILGQHDKAIAAQQQPA